MSRRSERRGDDPSRLAFHLRSGHASFDRHRPALETASMTKFGVAQSVPRVEDPRLLTGGGRYTDDIVLPGMLHGFVLRSPHAAAKLGRIDTSAAASLAGVKAIYTAADMKADGIGPMPCAAPVQNRDGSNMADPPHFALAEGMVRHVGDAVAFVVAETAK